MLTNKKTNFEDLQADLARKQAQLTALGTYDPPSVIAGRIDAQKQNPRWTWSRQCTDTTTPSSRQLCTEIATLESERQKGLQAAGLETAIDARGQRVGELAPASRIEGGDPRAGFLSRIFGWDILKVQTGFALLFIAVLELGSGLGLFIALSHGELAHAIKTGHLPPPEEEPPPPKALPNPAGERVSVPAKAPVKPVAAGPPPARTPAAPAKPASAPVASATPAGDVGKFAVACLAAEEGASVSFDDLFAAYQKWCGQQAALASKVDFRHVRRNGRRYCTDLRLS